MSKTLTEEAIMDVGTDDGICKSGKDVEHKYCGALPVKGIANAPIMERKNKLEELKMDMLVKVLAFAKDEEAALNVARNVMKEKIRTKILKEYVDFANGNPMGLIGEGLMGQIPPVLRVSTGRFPTDDKRGIEMVNDAMKDTRKEFDRLMAPLRYYIENYTNDMLFDQIGGIGEIEIDGMKIYDKPNCFRDYARDVGLSLQRGRIYLYDYNGLGVKGPVTLQEFLNGRKPFGIFKPNSKCQDTNWNQPLWVVPFYVKFLGH